MTRLYQDYDAAAALSGLIRDLGHDPELIRSKDLQEIANRLSEMAGRKTPWGWKALRNVQHRTQRASEKMKGAIMRMGALVDGMPAELAISNQVMITAVGKVRPGAIILADSKPCAYPPCGKHFVSTTPLQRYHSPACRSANQELKKGKESC